MAVAVGRLEADANIIRFITLSNNLVRGAAGGSVLNAELAKKWPSITKRKAPLPDAEEWKDRTGKLDQLIK